MKFVIPFALSISSFALLACQTTATDQQGEGEPLAYDGIVEEMDSLPDCNGESVGSLFWVRSEKTGFECKSDNQWNKRGSVPPEDAEPGPYRSFYQQDMIKRL